MLTKYLTVFLISMVPLIELRGAIPVSQAYGLPLLPSYILCIIGNMIPVPVIYLFARKFLEWGDDKKYIGGICSFFLTKGKKAGDKMLAKAGRGLYVALFLFVGIPLPGTGAWTGTLAASLLDMEGKKTVTAVLGGVLFAGIIMMSASFMVKSGVSEAKNHLSAAQAIEAVEGSEAGARDEALNEDSSLTTGTPSAAKGAETAANRASSATAPSPKN